MEKEKVVTVLISVRVVCRQVFRSQFLRELHHIMSHEFQRTKHSLKILCFIHSFKRAQFQVNAKHFATYGAPIQSHSEKF
jgi:hypothetical protein